MKFWQLLSSFMLTIGLSACMSTAINTHEYSSYKRPLTNDFELAMSLLNRPVPEDQQIMLAFAAQQQEQWGYMHYVHIIGDKESSPAPVKNSFIYAQIANDINAKTILPSEL